MANNTILQQMGIEQWRLREPLDISDDAVKTTEALGGSEALSNVEALSESTAPSDSKTSFDSNNTQTESENDIQQALQPRSQDNLLTKDESAPDNSISEVIVVPKTAQQSPQQHDWSSLIALLSDGENCSSCADASSILGDGNPSADWMFVFDSPTRRDIEQQKLLTGRVGQLFDAILLALDLDRDAIYLSSIFKCPPAENVTQNLAQCDSLLEHQLKLVQPKVVISFGEFTAQALVKSNETLDQLRQQEHRCFNQPASVVPTYSLMQMLDTPILKERVWDDLKSAQQLIKG